MKDNCGDFQAMLTGYLDSELTGETAARLQRHLAGCPRCRRELARWKEIYGWLEIPPEDPGPGFTSAVLAAIDELEEPSVAAAPWLPALALGMLFLISLAVGGLFWTGGRLWPAVSAWAGAIGFLFNSLGNLPLFKPALVTLNQLAGSLGGFYLTIVSAWLHQLSIFPLLAENLPVIFRAVPQALWGILLSAGFASLLLLGRLLNNGLPVKAK